MPKKKISKNLIKKTPSPKVNHPLITSLFILLALSIGFYFVGVTYTGMVIGTEQDQLKVTRQNVLLDNQFEVLEINKIPSSTLKLNLDSLSSINLFVEIQDCKYWLNGKDKDNTILYSLNNIKKGDLKIGDPSENTRQQLELYKTDYLCLIIINKQFPKEGNINLEYHEIDVNKWRIL